MKKATLTFVLAVGLVLNLSHGLESKRGHGTSLPSEAVDRTNHPKNLERHKRGIKDEKLSDEVALDYAGYFNSKYPEMVESRREVGENFDPIFQDNGQSGGYLDFLESLDLEETSFKRPQSTEDQRNTKLFLEQVFGFGK